MFLHDDAVVFDRSIQIAPPLRFLGPFEKLLRRAAHFVFAGRFVVRFFAGLEDERSR